MRITMDKEKEIERKIEEARESLYKKIERNLDQKEIQKASEELDKLIVEFLKI